VIVAATDFSPASRPAFAEALRFARRAGARLIVLHVLMPASPFEAGDATPSWVELTARARRDAEQHLAAAVARARRAGVDAEGALVEGAPAEAITSAARRADAEAIVLGTHGRSGWSRFFMGSVASGVLQLARCPVVTVRGRAARKPSARSLG
jgi:nucleotide-binding universal stress UspA family protein